MSLDLLLKQWDRYPRSTERISCCITNLKQIPAFNHYAVFIAPKIIEK